MVRAREFKEETGQNMRVVRQEGEQNVGRNPHRLCGKVHGRNECKVQCPCCKKVGSHRKEDCFELYPEKRPKSWITPTKKKGKGRGNDRERSRCKRVLNTVVLRYYIWFGPDGVLMVSAVKDY